MYIRMYVRLGWDGNGPVGVVSSGWLAKFGREGASWFV